MLENPSGALVKAVLLNGAKAILGAQDYNGSSGFLPLSPYDNHQGFGRVNLSHSMPLPGSTSDALRLHVKDRVQIASGDINEFYFYKENLSMCDESNEEV